MSSKTPNTPKNKGIKRERGTTLKKPVPPNRKLKNIKVRKRDPYEWMGLDLDFVIDPKTKIATIREEEVEPTVIEESDTSHSKGGRKKRKTKKRTVKKRKTKKRTVKKRKTKKRTVKKRRTQK